MEYTTLGTSGLKVSRVCLGTMTFGGQSDAEESGRIVRAAMDKGVNFIDTANIYPVMKGGVSESIVGESLRGVRDQVVLATKAGGRMGRGVNDSGLSRAHLVRSVEDSLRRLQTDYIDVFYLHFPDPATPIEETIQTMDMLVRSGKIRYYGLSNYSAWQCCDAVHKAREMGCLAPVVTESVYNLITRGLDDEMVPFLKQSGMGLAVYNPLAGGLLTGKHTRDHAEANSRYDSDRGYRARYWKERNWDAIEELVSMGGSFKSHGNISPVAEFNYWCDPDAAALGYDHLAKSGGHITMIGLDVTRRIVLTPSLLSLMERLNPREGAFIRKITGSYFDFHWKSERLIGCIVNDPLAVAYFLDHGMCRGIEAYTAVARDGICRGQCVVDEKAYYHRQANAAVMTDTDAARFFRLFFRRVLGASEADLDLIDRCLMAE